jgi:hypothetical protein
MARWVLGKLAGGDKTSRRIFAGADRYDAMVSDRPYRKGMAKKEVIEILRRKSGIQFDPNVIAVFVWLFVKDETIGTAKSAFPLVEQSTRSASRCRANRVGCHYATRGGRNPEPRSD